MSAPKASRGQRLVEHHAATTTDPRLKRILAPRTLEDVSPAFNRFLLNSAPIVTVDEVEKREKQQAGISPSSSENSSSSFWTPSAELVRNVKSNPDAEEEFHSMKLSRVLCKTISNEVEKKNSGKSADDTDHIPTRVSRVVVPASVQKPTEDDESGSELLIHSCAAVLASKILVKASNSVLVWIVENNNARDEVENVLEAVFGVPTSSFVVLSAASRTPVDLAKTSILSGSSSPAGRKSASSTSTSKKNLFIVTTTTSTGVNANRTLGETVLSATNSKQFSGLQILIFGQTEQSIKSIEVGLSTPKIVDAAAAETSSAASPISTTVPITTDTTTPRKLYYAVADGFGNFFAICKLIQNLSRGQRAVIHFATRNSALFFVDAFYALQNKSDSLLGQAAGLTLICDAENVPKRVESTGTGMSYEEMVSKHISAAAKRFTNLREDRTGVYISGFGVVPQLNSKTTVDGTMPGIFVQAESLPDVALAATSLFLSPASPLNDPKQYKTNILFVAPTEVSGGLVAALEEVLTTTTVASGSSASAGSRRGRNGAQPEESSSSLWSLAQLPLSSILRGTTDKKANLNQILEAREFQSLVRKIFALNASAYEAYRSYCLFYQTMCFGYHLDESVAALRKIVGSQKFGLGPKTAQWYEHCQKTATDSSAFATFLNLEGQAHRFGLENPPLLDLRTKDTEFRPRRDLYRFAVTAKTLAAREYKEFADVNLQPEKDDSDEGW